MWLGAFFLFFKRLPCNFSLSLGNRGAAEEVSAYGAKQYVIYA